MTRATRKRALLLIMSGALCAAGGRPLPALAGELQLTPSLALSEEFNDNIFDSAGDKQSEFITRVQPGVAGLYRTGSFSADLRYSFDYRNYARGSRGDEKTQSVAFRGNAAVTENFIFLELSDTFRRVSLDVARDVTSESLYANQTDQNVAVISPYLVWRPGAKSTLRTGYRYTDTRYWSVYGFSSGIDQLEHRGFADLTHQPSTRLTLSAGYAYSSVDTDIVGYDEHSLSFGANYEYALNSYLYAGIGNSWQSFSDSRSASNLFWHAGVTHDATFLVATVETRVQYTEDPLTISTREESYSARIERPFPQGNYGFSASHSKYENTLTGFLDRRRTILTGFWRYELSPRLTATADATGDRVSGMTPTDYPYRINGSVGVGYLFKDDLTASLSYRHVQYRHELGSASGARKTNRVIAELRKSF